jgi:predicted O-methyltransferase YrrM
METLTQKRFSFLDVTVLVAVLGGGLLYVAKVRADDREQVFRDMFAKSIEGPAPVVLAPDLPEGTAATYKNAYEFTTSWFDPHVPSWTKALEPFKGRPVHYLEVGVFEGKSAMWTADNILTDPASTLTGLDLFMGDYEEAHPDFEVRYRSNVEKTGLGDRALTVKGFSQIELRKLPLDHYDIAYIDGSHENRDVLEDAILTHRLLKSGGMLIFDDYGTPGNTDPKQGVDAFYRFWKDDYEVIHNQVQLIMRKK